MKCPHCKRTIPARALARAFAARGGAAGRGASKIREVDYAHLARLAAASRVANRKASQRASGKASQS